MTIAQKFIELSPDCVKLINPDGRVMAMNENGRCLMEIDDLSIVCGREWKSFWPEDSHHLLDAAMAAAAAGGTSSFQAACPTAKGTHKWWDVTVTRMPEEAQATGTLLAISRDITAAREAERKLKASEARFRSLVLATSALVWTCAAKGGFDSEQPEWAAFTGQAFHDYQGGGWIEAVHPEDRDSTLAAWVQASDAYQVFRIAHRLRRADGVYRDMAVRCVPMLDERGELVEWVGTHIDVTDEMRGETERQCLLEQIQADRERVLLATEAAQLGFWSWHSVDDLIHWDNERCYEIFGLPLTAEPITSCRFKAQFLHPDDHARFEHSVTDAIEQHADVAFEGRISRPDGQVRWVEFFGRLRQQYEGAPLQIVGTVRDVTDRKIADLELYASRERFEKIVNQAASGVVMMDTLGMITFVNQKYAQMLDYRPEELVGRNVTEVTSADSLQQTLATVAAVLETGKDAVIDKNYMRKDGSLMPATSGVNVLRSPNGVNQGLLAIVLDRSDHLRAEAALRASEERYRTLFESIDEGFCVIEFIDGPHGPMSDYVHLEANPAYMRHAGIPDIVGKTGRENLTESEANAWVEIFRRVVETGEPVRFERALESTDRYLEVACSRIEPASKRQVAIVFQDITARYRAERALQELNENLEGIVADRTRERDRMWDTTQDLMLLVDFNGYFRRVNPAWTAVLGYDEKELVGHHVNEFVIPDFHQAAVSAYTKASRGEQLSLVNCYRHKNGEPRWIAWTAAPDEHIIYANGRDITAERQQAAALASAEEALRQSQKMEAVGQLTGGLAHDFNNLLASISGGLQVLKFKLQRGQFNGLERYIDIGESSVRRAAALTQRLLAFSRRQTLDPKPTDVNRLIAGMDDLVRRSVGPTVDVEVVDAPDLWPTRIDAPQLENALLNLCINARDAMMPAGGKLTLVCANESIGERHPEPNMPPGEYVVLSVSDTGSGMPPEVIERIFDPFYTTKPLGEGTGLGLSMVHGFVHQSGGEVRVRSEVGAGTTMSLYLPRYVGTVAAEDSTASTPLESGHGETVLIIEDEPALRELIEEVLREAGYRVLTAQDGPTGLQVLRSNAHIDLLITDVGLPGGLNGRQVADAARIWRCNLKVLFITGYADAATIGDDGLASGMEVMTKPFDISTFANRVGSLFNSTNAQGALDRRSILG